MKRKGEALNNLINFVNNSVISKLPRTYEKNEYWYEKWDIVIKNFAIPIKTKYLKSPYQNGRGFIIGQHNKG